MENDDLFNLYTATVLSQLRAKFPVGQKLTVVQVWEEIPRLDGTPHDSVDDTQAAVEQSLVFETLMWLKDNNYINAIRSGREFRRATLTDKALDALNAKPLAIKPLAIGGKDKVAGKFNVGKHLVEFIFDLRAINIEEGC
jgi:hypothetical protein